MYLKWPYASLTRLHWQGNIDKARSVRNCMLSTIDFIVKDIDGKTPLIVAYQYGRLSIDYLRVGQGQISKESSF